MKNYIQPQVKVDQVKVTNHMMVVSPPQPKGGTADSGTQYSKDRIDDGWEEF